MGSLTELRSISSAQLSLPALTSFLSQATECLHAGRAEPPVAMSREEAACFPLSERRSGAARAQAGRGRSPWSGAHDLWGCHHIDAQPPWQRQECQHPSPRPWWTNEEAKWPVGCGARRL